MTTIGGWIDWYGTKRMGTSGWTFEKIDKGKYFIIPDNGGKVVSIVASIHVDMGDTQLKYLTGYTKDGYGYVYIYDPTDNTFGAGSDGAFNFVAIVE